MNRSHKILAILIAGIIFSWPFTVLAQQIKRDDTTGLVTSIGSNLTPAAGETVCTMSPNLAATVTANQPNGGLVLQQFSPTPCVAATVIATPPAATPTPTVTSVPNPIISLGASAGTGASFSLVAGSNLQRGAISITAGTSPSLGTILSITFPAGAPYVQLQAIGDNAAASGIYLRSLTSTVATVGVRTAMIANQTCIIGYILWPN